MLSDFVPATTPSLLLYLNGTRASVRRLYTEGLGASTAIYKAGISSGRYWRHKDDAKEAPPTAHYIFKYTKSSQCNRNNQI